jgi:uncharacterized damage-inducible protein DinB
MRPETDAQLGALVETTAYHISKLQRYVVGVNSEEMQWTPAGISNSLSWILRHCADQLWLTYARLSGECIPVNLGASGIAWSAVKGASFDQEAQGPGASAEQLSGYMAQAWQTLRAYLQSSTEWQDLDLVVGRQRQSAWTFLQHSIGDLCYHTGQASYLRKLLTAERRRMHARRRRVQQA